MKISNNLDKHQGLEGLCPEAVARVEGVHPTTVQRWVGRACSQAKAADQQVITGVWTENVELDERVPAVNSREKENI
jgi:hypothetical protein